MARRTRCWHVALAEEPETPLVEVRFVGPWYLLGFGRLEIEPVSPKGEVWATVVDEALRELPSLDAVGIYGVDPPRHWTRARVERILGQLPGRFPALTAYPTGRPPPFPLARERLYVLDAQTERLVDAVVHAVWDLGAAEQAGPDREGMRLVGLALDARDADALVAALDEVTAAAATRPKLARALRDRAGAALLADGFDPELRSRFERALAPVLEAGSPAR